VQRLEAGLQLGVSRLREIFRPIFHLILKMPKSKIS
jgi:hypothetical protein